MLILGIDTTEKSVNISLAQSQNILYEIEKKTNRTEDLTNCLKTAFDKLEIKPIELEAIGVITGPGGYTGTRSGVVVAKTLAQFLNKPIIGFNKIEALLLSCEENKNIAIALDIKRDEVYGCIGSHNKSEINYFVQPQIFKFDAWLDLLKKQNNLSKIISNDFKNKKDLFFEHKSLDFDFYLKPSLINILTLKFMDLGKYSYFNQIEPFYIRNAI